MNNIPTDDELIQMMSDLSNWGRWGEQDQLGCLNLITPQKIIDASNLVTEGRTISCARPITTDHEADVTYQVQRFMVDSGEGRGADTREKQINRKGAAEFIGMVFHGQTITHIDALSHYSWRGLMYNGVPSDLVTSKDGAQSHSIEATGSGLVTRGVLLDIAALKGKTWLNADEPVFPEDLEAAELRQGVKVEEGDIVDSVVHAVVEWGIFLTYKGLTLLLHVSDLSHGRVKKPSDLVTIGQKLKVKITKIDPKTNRVSASVKALTEDPYENIEKKYKVGEIYEGVVTKIMDYGCFVKIEDGVEGLIHSSELDWTNRNIKPNKVLSVSQKIKFKIASIDKDTKRISLSYKATLENPWDKIKDLIGKETKIKINNITDKAIFGELIDSKLSGMLHYKEISYQENIEDLKKFKKNDVITVRILEIKDDKIRFSKRALDKDPMDWFKENKKKVGSVISTKVVEVLKTGVKVAVDPEKKIIVTIKKNLLAVEPADCRPEIYSPGNTMADAKIQELDIKNRKIVLSPKAAQIDEEKSLVAKFGEGAAKSGATLKGIFEKAIGSKKKKKKEEK